MIKDMKNKKGEKYTFSNKFNDFTFMFIILKYSFMLSLLLGVGYIFLHAGGGQLTIPNYFKNEVFNPDESIGQEILKYRYEIFWYWVGKGIQIAIASFFILIAVITSTSFIAKRISTFFKRESVQ